MIWTILALVLWIVLGGFISYYGDLQGRRWGKRRVSWFGLRPKHTAILITSITGGIVAALSITAVMLLVAPVRSIVLGGEHAIHDNNDLNAKLVKQRMDYKSELKTEAGKYSYLKASSAKLEQQLNQEAKETKARQQDLARLEDKNRKLQSGLQSVAHTLIAERRDVSRLLIAKQQLARDNDRFAKMNDSIARQNLVLEHQNLALGKLKTSLEASIGDLKSSNTELEHKNSGLAAVNSGLQAENGHLKANNDEISAESERQAKHAAQLAAEVTGLETKRDDLYSQLLNEHRDFTQAYIALRQLPLNVRVDAELGRRTLDAHLRPQAVKAQLLALLEDASAAAIMHGAARGDNGRAVQIVNKRVVTLVGVQDTDEEESLSALADTVAGSDSPVVVVVNAVNNSVEGEQVLVEISPHAVTHAFDKGEVVAMRRINARATVKSVVGDILTFLQKDVRDSALNRGIIPEINPETGAREIGVVGPEELVALTEQVRKLGGQVQLSAVAAANTSSGDPLALNFQVARRPDANQAITPAQ